MANKTDEGDADTPGGALLSKSQREWLIKGGEDPDTPAHRSLRMRIRERLQQGFMDFALLNNLPNEDAEKIFQNPSPEVAEGMASVLSFVFRRHIRDILDNPPKAELSGSRTRVAGRATSESFEDFFGFILSRAIERALEAESVTGYHVDVDVEIAPIEGPQIDTAIEKIQSGQGIEDLDYGELLNLLREARRAGAFRLEALTEAAARKRQQYLEQAANGAEQRTQSDGRESDE